MLFATLDPTSRAIELPHGEKAILSDTVGFISDLPTMLVAAFRATLEDVVEADVLLHVRDVSHGETEAQAGDVAIVLRELGIDPDDTKRIIEVWNKADLSAADERERLATASQPDRRGEAADPHLGPDGRGHSRTARHHRAASRHGPARATRSTSAPEDGQGLAWLHENTEILDRETTENGHTILRIRLVAGKEPRFLNRFPRGHASYDDALGARARRSWPQPRVLPSPRATLRRGSCPAVRELPRWTEAPLELGIRAPQGRLGIDPEMAGEVGDGEQKIPDLVLDPVLRSRLKRLP